MLSIIAPVVSVLNADTMTLADSDVPDVAGEGDRAGGEAGP
jgi:hypothetical protein